MLACLLKHAYALLTVAKIVVTLPVRPCRVHLQLLQLDLQSLRVLLQPLREALLLLRICQRYL